MKLTIYQFSDLTETGLRDVLVFLRALLDIDDTRKRPRRTLQVANQYTDDQAAKLVITGKDQDGVPAQLGTLSATVDDPTLATVIPDPTDPTLIYVKALPVPAGGASTRTVNVTVTDTMNNVVGAPIAITFVPGGEASLEIEIEGVPVGSIPTAAAAVAGGATA